MVLTFIYAIQNAENSVMCSSQSSIDLQNCSCYTKYTDKFLISWTFKTQSVRPTASYVYTGVNNVVINMRILLITMKNIGIKNVYKVTCDSLLLSKKQYLPPATLMVTALIVGTPPKIRTAVITLEVIKRNVLCFIWQMCDRKEKLNFWKCT